MVPIGFLCAKHLKASKTIQNHFVDSARLQVSDPQTKHRLNEFQAEFSLWASMTNFSTYAQHTYWRDANMNSWWIRSKHCLKVTKPKEGVECNTCEKCLEVGSSRGVLKSVLSFNEKYMVAELLSTRLFQGLDAAAAYEESIRKSATRLLTFHQFSIIFMHSQNIDNEMQ